MDFLWKSGDWSISVIVAEERIVVVTVNNRFMGTGQDAHNGTKELILSTTCVASIIALIITGEEYKAGVRGTHSNDLLVIFARYMSSHFFFLHTPITILLLQVFFGENDQIAKRKKRAGSGWVNSYSLLSVLVQLIQSNLFLNNHVECVAQQSVDFTLFNVFQPRPLKLTCRENCGISFFLQKNRLNFVPFDLLSIGCLFEMIDQVK